MCLKPGLCVQSHRTSDRLCQRDSGSKDPNAPQICHLHRRGNGLPPYALCARLDRQCGGGSRLSERGQSGGRPSSLYPGTWISCQGPFLHQRMGPTRSHCRGGGAGGIGSTGYSHYPQVRPSTAAFHGDDRSSPDCRFCGGHWCTRIL